LAYSTS